MRAAAQGLVDFSKSRFEDPAWWRRFNLIIEELESKLGREYAQFVHSHYAALVGCAVGSELQGQFLKNASEQFLITTKLMFPWHDSAAADKRNQEMVSDAYKEHVGDMNDPAYRQQVELLVEELNQRRLKTAQTAREREDLSRKMAQSRIDAKRHRKR